MTEVGIVSMVVEDWVFFGVDAGALVDGVDASLVSSFPVRYVEYRVYRQHTYTTVHRVP